MIQSGTAAGQVILTAFVLNLKHLLMGASLAPHLKRHSLLAYFINDESYAVTITRSRQAGGSAAHLPGAGIVTFSTWVLSTSAQSAIKHLVSEPSRYGLDFAFFGAFIGLLIPQLKDRLSWACFGTSALVALAVSQLLPGKWYVVVADSPRWQEV
ncbi:MAG: AzlC family ABC transporter permease [Bacillota bacterium]